MKKTILLLILSALFVFDVSAQNKPKKNRTNKEKTVQMPADQKTSANARSNSRTLIFNEDLEVSQGKYVDIQHSKNYLYQHYKYEVEVTLLNSYAPGKIDLSVYGDQRFIRDATPTGYGFQTYYAYDDLRSHERNILLSIYGYKYSRFRIKIWKVKKQHDVCHYTNPLYDLGWLKDKHHKYPNYKICEYEIHGKKYFQLYQCGISHFTEYWYDCYGREICKFNNGFPCNDIKDARLVKCWYTPQHCGTPQHCDYKVWFNDCKYKKAVVAGSNHKVVIGAENYHKIKWIELYINGHKIRRENNYPYEWGGNGSNDQYLRNIQPGTYELKCVIYDECGKYREEYCKLVVGGNQYCDKNLWYEKGKHGSHYRRNSNVTVQVKAQKHQDIEWCELYVNGHKVRREMRAPYQWGKPYANNDHALNHMRPGTYVLKCVYKTKCGQKYEKKSTIYIDN